MKNFGIYWGFFTFVSVFVSTLIKKWYSIRALERLNYVSIEEQPKELLQRVNHGECNKISQC